jgi:hypothetical protein
VMSSARLYRAASVLFVVFAVAHSLGFRQVDPQWNMDATVAAMKTTFLVQGQTRSYWDFFSGLGFFISLVLLFCVIFAWQLGSVPPDVRNSLKLVRWAFAACFVVVTITTWFYIGPLPTIVTGLVALVLVLAAWQRESVTA